MSYTPAYLRFLNPILEDDEPPFPITPPTPRPVVPQAPVPVNPFLPQLEPDEPGLLGTIGDILDRPGNAVRGLLAGRPEAMKGLIPFSESLGIYDPNTEHVSGQELNEKLFGIEQTGDLLSGAGAAGLATEILADPLNLLPGFMGLKALTKTGRAAKVTGQHLDDAARTLTKYNTEKKAFQAWKAAAETAGQVLPEKEILRRAPKAPVSKTLGNLVDDAGQAIPEAELMRRLATGEHAAGQAARDVLETARPGVTDPFRLAGEAGARVNAGQEALFSAGGPWQPFIFGGPTINLPQKTLIEGAGAAQALQDAGRYVKNLPPVAAVGKLFQKVPHADAGVRKIIEEEREAALREAAAGERQAATDAEELMGRMAGIKEPLPMAPPVRVGDEIVDPLTGEIISTGRAAENPNIWKPVADEPGPMLGSAPQDLGAVAREAQASRYPPATDPLMPLVEQARKEAAETPLLEPLRQAELPPEQPVSAISEAVQPETLPKPIPEAPQPDLASQAAAVKVGHRVSFDPRGAVASPNSRLRKVQYGIVAAENSDGTLTIKNDVGQWIVKPSGVDRLKANVAKDLRKLQSQAMTKGMTPAEKRAFEALERERVQAARHYAEGGKDLPLEVPAPAAPEPVNPWPVSRVDIPVTEDLLGKPVREADVHVSMRKLSDVAPKPAPLPVLPAKEMTFAKGPAYDALVDRRNRLVEEMEAAEAAGKRPKASTVDAFSQTNSQIQAREGKQKIQDALTAAGVGAERAAIQAARLLPEDASPAVMRQIGDYVERGGYAPQDVAEVGDHLRDRFETMLKTEQEKGVQTPALKSEQISYTTHVPTDYGAGVMKNVARNKKMQGRLFVALEEMRAAKGAATGEGLAPLKEQKQARMMQRIREGEAAATQTQAVPALMKRQGDARLLGLDDDTKAFLVLNDLGKEFGAFSREISTAHPSQIARLPAYRDLTVAELNEAYRNVLGAKSPVWNENPAAQLFTREARHFRAMAGKNFFDQVGAKLGAEKPKLVGTPATEFPGVERFSDGSYGSIEQNTQRTRQGLPPIGYDDPQTAKAVADVHGKMQNPEEVGYLLEKYDALTRTMKSWVTRAFPAFHVRNHVSNRVQSWLGDVPMTGEHYALANKAIAGKDFSVTLGDGQTVTRDALIEEAQRKAVLDGGWYEDLLREQLDPTRKPTWNPLDPDNMLVRAGERVGAGIASAPGMALSGAAGQAAKMDGKMVEASDRLGHYLFKRMQGWTPDAAAKDVNTYLFDYSKRNMSEWEQKYANRAIFFYGYTRNVIPMMLEATLNNGRKVGGLARLGIQPGRPDVMPTYAKEGVGIPLGTDSEGNAQVAYGTGLPLEAAVEPFAGFMEGPRRGLAKLATLANPLLRAPVEAAAGKDFFLGKDIEDLRKAPHWVEDLPAEAKTALGVQEIATKRGTKYEMDPWGLWALRNTPLSRISNTLSRATDERKGGGEQALNLLTGARIVSVDEQDEAKYKLKNLIKQRLKELERQGRAREIEVFAQGLEKDPETAALLKALRG